ncbi:MAG: hypothetical protein IKC60_03780 [Clostridia bacterium]|nr:hypothetical protein [Clostridia bacterium]
MNSAQLQCTHCHNVLALCEGWDETLDLPLTAKEKMADKENPWFYLLQSNYFYTLKSLLENNEGVVESFGERIFVNRDGEPYNRFYFRVYFWNYHKHCEDTFEPSYRGRKGEELMPLPEGALFSAELTCPRCGAILPSLSDFY